VQQEGAGSWREEWEEVGKFEKLEICTTEERDKLLQKRDNVMQGALDKNYFTQEEVCGISLTT
jgi:hypothetical protein